MSIYSVLKLFPYFEKYFYKKITANVFTFAVICNIIIVDKKKEVFFMARDNNTSVTIRMNKELKNQAQALFSDLGVSMSTAIDIFIRQAVSYGGFPFEVKRHEPNAETLEAMKEVEYMQQHPDEFKGYTNVDEMFKELLA